MATASLQDQFWTSREAVAEEGIIDFYNTDRGFGYIAVDTANKPERYWFHFSAFPEEQRDLIRLGKRVRFSSEGGQQLAVMPDGKRKWPRISEAKFAQ
jgi:cold shock CspA family protein